MIKKIGRNEKCNCGSGEKYKKCCLKKDSNINPKLKMLNHLLYQDNMSEDMKRELGIEINMSRNEYERIQQGFVKYAEQRVVKLLIETEIPDYQYYISGSGSYLHYRDKHYFVTCEHCVSSVEPHERIKRVKAICSNEGNLAIMKTHHRDLELDLAVFELDSDYAHLGYYIGYDFVIERYIETNYQNYLEMTNNTLLIYGSPGENSGFDYETGELTTNFQTYCTFYTGYSNEYDLLNINIARYAFKSDGTYDIPNEVSGLSGSWVFCYKPEAIRPYHCVGMMVRGRRDSGNMWALGIDKILSFIDNHFYD